MSCKNIIFSLDGSWLFYHVLMSSGRSHWNNLHILPCFVAVILGQKSVGLWWCCATLSTIQFFDFVYYSQTKIKNLNKKFWRYVLSPSPVKAHGPFTQINLTGSQPLRQILSLKYWILYIQIMGNRQNPNKTQTLNGAQSNIRPNKIRMMRKKKEQNKKWKKIEKTMRRDRIAMEHNKQ
jgi:hypothetical protein